MTRGHLLVCMFICRTSSHLCVFGIFRSCEQKLGKFFDSIIMDSRLATLVEEMVQRPGGTTLLSEFTKNTKTGGLRSCGRASVWHN